MLTKVLDQHYWIVYMQIPKPLINTYFKSIIILRSSYRVSSEDIPSLGIKILDSE